MDRIPYYIRHNENPTITDTDFLYYDNNTDTAQSITYAELKDKLETELVITAAVDYKPHFLFMGA